MGVKPEPGVTQAELAEEAATRGSQISTLSDLIQDGSEATSALTTRVDNIDNTGGGAILPWQAARYYALGAPMTQGGATYTRNVAGTARGTFDATEQGRWTVLPSAAQSGSGVVLDAKRDYGVLAGSATADYATQLQNFFNALRDAGPGATGILPPAPIVTSVPILFDSFTAVQGTSGATVLKLADNTNGGAAVLKSRNFDSLTLGGSVVAGEGLFTLRDFTIDGNKANNASAGRGLAIYGYKFTLDGLTIRNTKGSGLYTEWGKLGVPAPDGEMEARFARLNVHHCDGNGWHMRGPHDSQFWSINIQNNAQIGLWMESGGDMTVAAGSNGVDVNTFQGAGVLNVNIAVGAPTSGTVVVVTASGNRTITYTGRTDTSLTGCTASGSGVISTGAAITLNGKFSSTGLVGSAMHVWGPHTIGVQLDNSLLGCASFLSEGATVGQVLMRTADSWLIGGKVFTGGAASSYGIKLGDANYKATQNHIDLIIGDQDFAGTDASTASVNFANTGSNKVHGLIIARSGTSHIVGTPAASDDVNLTAVGQTTAINASNSLRKFTGPTTLEIGSGGSALVVKSNTADWLNIDPATPRINWLAGVLHRFYQGAYTNASVEIDSTNGRLRFPLTTAPGIASVAAAIGTSGNGAAVAISGNDRRGTITVTTASALGATAFPTTVANVTYSTAWGSTPRVILTPQNAASAAILPYAQAYSTTQFLIGFNGTPAVSTTYTFTYLVEG